MQALKALLKRPFFRLIDRVLSNEHVRERIWQAGRPMFARPCRGTIPTPGLAPLPARYRSAERVPRQVADTPPPIFITARFRSGSTFLWQLFRNIDGITCYYEPLNEARWFEADPGKSTVDRTHIGVDDYRAEYEGMRDLAKCFDDAWTDQRLYMDEADYDPKLDQYISELIARARGRPVLQFNHVDFRLAWLRAHFPQACILHLYRHPREQWMSIIGKGDSIDRDARITPGQLTVDHFYTLEWARDLRAEFPLLEPAGRHPYELHYLLWRLSYSFGRAYGDVSICYEDLIGDFAKIGGDMFHQVGVRNADLARLAKLNHGRQAMRWPEYADESWFQDLESRCDRELEAMFASPKSTHLREAP